MMLFVLISTITVSADGELSEADKMRQEAGFNIDDGSSDGGFAARALAQVIHFFASSLENFLPQQFQLQHLVFGGVEGSTGNSVASSVAPIQGFAYADEDGDSAGLTIMSSGKVGQMFRELYIQYRRFVIPFMFIIGIFRILSFYKLGDHSQTKQRIKESYVPYIYSFILLGTLPLIIDFLYLLDDAIVRTSYQFIYDRVGYDFDIFSEISAQLLNFNVFIGALLTVAVALLAIVFAVYYFIRDITIMLLFLFSPFIAIKYAFGDKDSVKSWLQNLAGAMLTRSIHSILLIVLLFLASGMAGATEDQQWQWLMLTVTFLASILPITATIKQFLGVEGSVGGAKSMAGMGMVMGAVALTRGATKKWGESGEQIEEGKAQMKQADSLNTIKDKGYSAGEGSSVAGSEGTQASSATGMASSVSNEGSVPEFAKANATQNQSQDPNLMKRQGKAMVNEGRMRRATGVGLSLAGAGAGALMTSSLGSGFMVKGAMVGGAAGYSGGHKYGGKLSDGYNQMSAEKEASADYEQQVNSELETMAYEDLGIDSNTQDAGEKAQVEKYIKNSHAPSKAEPGLRRHQLAQKRVLGIDKFPMEQATKSNKAKPMYPGAYQPQEHFGETNAEQDHIQEVINAHREKRVASQALGNEQEGINAFAKHAPQSYEIESEFIKEKQQRTKDMTNIVKEERKLSKVELEAYERQVDANAKWQDQAANNRIDI